MTSTHFTTGTTITSEWLNDVNDAVYEGNITAEGVQYTPPFTGGVTETVEAKLAQTVSVKDFGAVGDGVTDDTAAFQSAVDYVASLDNGGAIYIPIGEYSITSTVSMDRSADSSLGRVSLFGEDQNGTRIVYSGSGDCFYIANSHTGTGEPNSSYQSISDMTILGPSKAADSSAITVNLAPFLRFSSLNIQGFDYGLYLQDADQFYAEKLTIRFNNQGIFARKAASPGAASVQPNNHTYVSCSIGNNTTSGGSWFGGADINFFGGDVEYNGGSNALGFGLKFSDCGYEGGRGANIQGVYFEGNHGVADIILSATTVNTNPILNSVHQINADFKRLNSAAIDSTYHIYCDFGNPATVGVQKVILTGCSFRVYGGYTGTNPVVYYNATQPTLDTFFDLGSYYQLATEKPEFVQNLNKEDAVVTKLTNQTFTSGVLGQWLLDTIVPPSALWSPSFSTNNIIINSSGTYAISVFLQLSTLTSGQKRIVINKNGSPIGYGEATGTSELIEATTTWRLTEGDLIGVSFIQSTGSPQDIVGGSLSNSALTITKIYG